MRKSPTTIQKKRAKVLVISGTPGVGKSTLARYLQKKFGWRRLDLHDYYPLLSLGYNRKKQCYDLDPRKVEQLVKSKAKENQLPLIIDSHLAHHLPPKLVDLCVILTFSNLKQLRRRLEKRGYGKSKVKENLEAEIFQICLIEARENGHVPLVFETVTKRKLPRIGGMIYRKLSEINKNLKK